MVYWHSDVADYVEAFFGLAWGEHGHPRNELVHRYWQWLDNVKGLGACNAWCEGLLGRDGPRDNPHEHIIAAIVAERLE